MNEDFLEKFKSDTKEEISKLNYKKYFYQFSDAEKLVLAKELKDIENFFKEELELTIYPVYGTLLGIIRDNDFIGWDTDIDVAYMSKCHTNKAVLNEFNMICKFLEEKKILMYRIKTASHLHIYSPNRHLKADLWISWIDLNNNYHIVWTVGGDIDSLMILPFKTIEFKNQIFNQINNPEQFLNEHYNNWKVPISGEAKEWNKRKFIFELETWQGK
jgi:phosphorylcholine metabolism protein LicD